MNACGATARPAVKEMLNRLLSTKIVNRSADSFDCMIARSAMPQIRAVRGPEQSEQFLMPSLCW